MASQTEQKNKVVTVTGLKDSAGNIGLNAKVSKEGSDIGKVISVTTAEGEKLNYTSAKTAAEDTYNKTKIENTLKAFPGVEKFDGVIDEEAYNQSGQGTATGVPQNTVDAPPASFSNKAGTNVSGKVFMVPVDMQISGEGSQDHIRIRALKYKPPQGNTGSDPIIGANFESVVQKGLKSANADLPPGNYDYQGEVILPIPTAVRDRASASWAMSKLSPITAAGVGLVAAPAIEAAGGDIGALGTAFRTVLKTVGGIFGAGGTEEDTFGFNQIAAASLSTALLKSINLGAGLEPSDILARVSGKAANPNMELLFRGPNMRVFDLGWKFVSRSPEEAKRLRQIIKFLKVQSLPELSQNANLINSPNVFFIRYMNGNSRIKSLPQPKICALTDFGIDHTPDNIGWSAYEDSHPVATAITMQFLELTPLFRNEIEAAFPEDDDVGY